MTDPTDMSDSELREAVAAEVFDAPFTIEDRRALDAADAAKRAAIERKDYEEAASAQRKARHEDEYIASHDAAFLVVRRLEDLGFEMLLSNGNGPKFKWDCEVTWALADETKPCALGQANEAPRAICLAALSIVRALKKKAP